MSENTPEDDGVRIPQEAPALDELDGDEMHKPENIGEEVEPEHGLDVDLKGFGEDDSDE
jgi:hypothetical protein